MALSNDDSKYVVALVINFVLAVLFLSLFLFFRKRVPVVYEPRCDGSPIAPPSPPSGIFAWIMPTLRIPTESLYASHGMDVYMFIRLLECMFFIVFVEFLFGVFILYPVYATGEYTRAGTDPTLFVQGLPRISMASVGQNSPRLVASLLSAVAATAAIMYFTYKTYNHYARHRRYFKVAPFSENYTALVREIPQQIDSEDKLQNHFERILPGATNGVNLARVTPELDKLYGERETAVRKLEHANAVFEAKGARPTNKTKFIGGEKVDSIDWWTSKLNDADKQIAVLHAQPHPMTGVAFVTFIAIQGAMQCAQVVLGKNNTWWSNEAPDSRAIIWQNLKVTHHSRMIRSVIANIFMFFLVFFWLIPVTFVSGLSHLSTLALVPGLGFLVRITELSPVISGFIEGFLPTLALIIFYALLVKIITAVANAQGLYNKIALDRSVLSKYFYFQIFNIFIGITIGSTIFQRLQPILNANFGFIVTLLAGSLPFQGFFFTNYIMLMGMTKATMALWRPGPLIVRWIFRKFLYKTPREFRERDRPGAFLYSVPVSTHLLVFVLVSFYSTLYPFILPWGMVYFAVHILSARYNLIYVYIPDWEGAGYFWPTAFNRICAGSVLYLALLTIVFGGYRFAAATVISALCLVAILVFWWYTNKRFARECEHGAVEEVALRGDDELVAPIGGRSYSPLINKESLDLSKPQRRPLGEFSEEYRQPTMTTPLIQLESKAL